MISKTMQQAFNDQIREEMNSFYVYLQMANYFDTQYFDGFKAWMRAQANEEMSHAMKFLDYVQERGGDVVLQAMPAPQATWDSPLAVFEAALAHERHITARIHSLVDQARAENDHASLEFLQWFVKEQVEEEATVEPIVHRMRMIGEAKGNAIFFLDHQLGKRQ